MHRHRLMIGVPFWQSASGTLPSSKLRVAVKQVTGCRQASYAFPSIKLWVRRLVLFKWRSGEVWYRIKLSRVHVCVYVRGADLKTTPLTTLLHFYAKEKIHLYTYTLYFVKSMRTRVYIRVVRGVFQKTGVSGVCVSFS